MQAVLRSEDGRAIVVSWPLFPHAHDRLFRRAGQRARHCLALLGLTIAGRFSALGKRDKVPDHSWLSKTRSRLPHEVHDKVFAFVLKLVAERGLVKGERIGVDGSTMEANAALRAIVRRDNGETYREMLTRMAKESGVETPTIDDLIRLDRKRKGKKLSNEDWTSKTNPDAKIAKMKDGSTRPTRANTATLNPTLREAEKNLSAIGPAPTPEDPCDLVADKGYHSRDVLKDLDEGPWKTRISEPRPSKGYSRWHGDDAARAAVYGNRNRLKSGVGREAMRKRGEVVERSFAHGSERGGMRRTWLRGRENIHKRYLVHVAGYNLGVLMRAVRSRHAEGGRQRQICAHVRHSGRRHDRLRNHRRVRRGDGGAHCRRNMRSHMIELRHFHRAGKPDLSLRQSAEVFFDHHLDGVASAEFVQGFNRDLPTHRCPPQGRPFLGVGNR